MVPMEGSCAFFLLYIWVAFTVRPVSVYPNLATMKEKSIQPWWGGRLFWDSNMHCRHGYAEQWLAVCMGGLHRCYITLFHQYRVLILPYSHEAVPSLVGRNMNGLATATPVTPPHHFGLQLNFYSFLQFIACKCAKYSDAGKGKRYISLCDIHALCRIIRDMSRVISS